jgi:O-antigen ligase
MWHQNMKLFIVFWIILFAISMHTVPRTFDSLQSNPIDAFRLVRIISMAITATLVVYPLLSLRCIELAFRPPLCYVLLYAFMAFISIIYSPLKALTLWKSTEILVGVGLATVVSVNYIYKGPEKFLKINTIFLCLLVIIMEMESIISPERAWRWRGEGILRMQLGGVMPYMNPSAFGYIAAIASAMSFASLLRNKGKGERWLYAILFVASTVGTILSHCRTAMGAFVVAIALILMLNRKFLLSLIVLSISLVTIFFIPQTQSYWLRNQEVFQVQGISGRSLHWQYVWTIAKESPVYGYGFYAAQKVLFNSDTTDNFYLDIFLGMGILGVFIMTVLIFNVWRNVFYISLKAWKSQDESQLETASKLLGMLVILSVIGLTTRGFSIHSEAFMVFMTIVTSIQIIRNGETEDIEEEVPIAEETNFITQPNMVEK